MTKNPPGRKLKGLEKRVPCRLMLEPRIIRELDFLRGKVSRADMIQNLILKLADRKPATVTTYQEGFREAFTTAFNGMADELLEEELKNFQIQKG
jgi:hypothetical protein